MARKAFLLITLAAALTLALAPLAFASPAASGEGDAHAGSKPELMHWDFGTALWSIGVFVILLVILRVAAWKPILAGLQQREEFIRSSLDDAARERKEAERLLAAHTERMNEAREEATAIVEEGRRDAEEVRKRVQAEAKAESEAIAARARRDIEIARDQAVKELYDHAVELATLAASKIVAKELAPGDHRALIDESLAEMARLSN